jgi:hypothetical protein
MDKITGQQPVYPIIIDNIYDTRVLRECTDTGLTIRQHYAGLCMQGLLAAWGNHDVTGYDDLAHDAVKAADELIAALNKEVPNV